MATSPETVRRIRQRLDEDAKVIAIAEELGVSRHVVSRIKNDKSFAGDEPEKDLEQQVIDLQADLTHALAEKRAAQKQAKSEISQRGLFKAMREELEQSVPTLTPPNLLPIKPSATQNERDELVLHMSDGHHDQVVSPEECGGLERYDFPVSCVRGENLIEQVGNWIDTMAGKYQYDRIWVLAYGDHTSGEIHNHAQRSYYRNQMRNCLAIGQLHALMFRDLASMIPNVEVVYVPGNHGRRTVKKDFHGAHDNWDYLVAEIARLHCRDINNLNFIIPDAYSVNLDINGVGFNISHGDDVRGALGIPYYGLQRRARNLAAIEHVNSGPRVRYFCCGHFHKPGSIGDMDGETIVNGPWVATDSYAYNSFAGYTEPQQWLHNVNPTKGITWRASCKIRDPKREQMGPQRYKVQL